MVLVVEILPHGKRGAIYPWSISLLLMTWRNKEPGHWWAMILTKLSQNIPVSAPEGLGFFLFILFYFFVERHVLSCCELCILFIRLHVRLVIINPIALTKLATAQEKVYHGISCTALGVVILYQVFMSHIITFLSLKVWVPSYHGLTRSISWLLMPWLLVSPGHQQPWYWLCKLCRSLTPCLTQGRISITHVMSVCRNDINCKYMFISLVQNQIW